MRSRSGAALLAMAALFAGVLLSALPAGAPHTRAADSAQLALPQSALPADAAVAVSSVSDNADADKSQIHFVHGSKTYEAMGRVSGYHMLFQFSIQGSQVGTEYLASIFGTADQATAAMNDAVGDLSLVAIIGKPLPQPCTAGESCKAFSGPNPLSPASAPQRVVFAVFTRGPILVETASQAPASTFDQIEPALQTTLYGLLAAADAQAKQALGPEAAPTQTATSVPAATPTVAPTNTPVPPTDTPTPRPTPRTAAAKKCKKGYGRSHGKCVKCKKGYVVVHGKCTKRHA